MSYSISEVSKLLNITVESLRFYEDKGIISPGRKANGKYRSYEAWEIFRLYECLQYKSFHFSLNEIEKTMNSTSIDYYANTIRQKITDIREEIHFNTILTQRLSQVCEQIETAKANIDNYWVQKKPEMYFIYNTIGRGDKYEKIIPPADTHSKWLDYIAFTDFLAHVTLEDYQAANNRQRWCSSIEKSYIDYFKIPVSEKVHHVPAHYYLCTNVDMGGVGDFSLDGLVPLF